MYILLFLVFGFVFTLLAQSESDLQASLSPDEQARQKALSQKESAIEAAKVQARAAILKVIDDASAILKQLKTERTKSMLSH